MTSVERVKQLCKERKIPVARLERELGFSNGYIAQLRRGTFPAERLAAIAEYFGCDVEYLMYGKEKEKPTVKVDSGFVDRDAFMRLQEANGLFLALDDAGKAQAIAYLRFLASQQGT